MVGTRAFALCVAAAAVSNATAVAPTDNKIPATSSREGQREKLAEGEFVHIPAMGGAPLSHAWTLWREPSGGFLIEASFSVILGDGELELQSRQRSTYDEQFRLLRQESVARSSIPGEPISGKSCRLEPGRYSCSFGEARELEIDALEIGREVSADIQGPFELFAVRAWQLARYAAHQPLDPGQSTEIKLIELRNDAVDSTSLLEQTAIAGYIGREDVDVLGIPRPAHKYEIEFAEIEGMRHWHLWVADDGIPLRAEAVPPGGDPFSPYRIELRSFRRF